MGKYFVYIAVSYFSFFFVVGGYAIFSYLDYTRTRRGLLKKHENHIST